MIDTYTKLLYLATKLPIHIIRKKIWPYIEYNNKKQYHEKFQFVRRQLRYNICCLKDKNDNIQMQINKINDNIFYVDPNYYTDEELDKLRRKIHEYNNIRIKQFFCKIKKDPAHSYIELPILEKKV